MFVYFRAPIRWTALARRTVADTFADGCRGLAAQLALNAEIDRAPESRTRQAPAASGRQRIGPAAAP